VPAAGAPIGEMAAAAGRDASVVMGYRFCSNDFTVVSD